MFPFQNISHKIAKIGYTKKNKKNKNNNNKTKLIKPTAMGNKS
jgi:hypothetical protein